MAASSAVQRRLATIANHVSFGKTSGRDRPVSIHLTSQGGGMKDEYGQMDASGETFTLPRFELESGRILQDVEVRYRTWGTLNLRRDNALVVCHALTGNASLDSWCVDPRYFKHVQIRPAIVI